MKMKTLKELPFGKVLFITLAMLSTFTAYTQSLPSAAETAKAISIGWNLGNTLEAIGGETKWGNPMASQILIDSVKRAGINSVRLPVAWNQYADPSTNTIDPQWMARVKTVVDYCINKDMYVLLNIHWDNGWLENNCKPAKKDSVNIKQNAYWTQIATYFKDYDGHLIFASANEPAVENAEEMEVLLSYHQTFVNAVRATGGNNGTRTLVIQGPVTDITKTNELMNTLPADVIANRLMVEVHYYTPWNFCGMDKDADWGKMFYYWGKDYHSTTDVSRNATYGEEEALDELFLLMKTKFIDKGIPVIIGEFGAIKRTDLTGESLALHTASREYFLNYATKAATRLGMPVFYWDNGKYGNNSFGLFDREFGTILDKGAVKAMMQGAGVVTGTQVALEKNKFQISPNPYSHSFHLEIAEGSNLRNIIVMDLLGNQLEKTDANAITNHWNMGHTLPSGTYLVVVQGENEVQTFKVTKK